MDSEDERYENYEDDDENNDGVEVSRRREGRVWKQSDSELMATDTISGNLPVVKKLAERRWSYISFNR